MTPERLDRRQILQGASLLGLSSAAALALGSQSPASARTTVLSSSCTLSPSLVEGPYYHDLNLVREDITEGLPGIPLHLYFKILDVDGCTPLPNAEVDVWQCNADGVYSNFSSQGTANETWLRGVQFANAAGIVHFKTIYPGWYPGRTTHIHAKVYPQTNYELTTQTYFHDSLTSRIYQLQPYVARGQKDRTNTQDAFFRAETQMGTIVTFDFAQAQAVVVAGLTIVVDRP